MEAAGGAAFANERGHKKTPSASTRGRGRSPWRTGNLSRSSFLAGFRCTEVRRSEAGIGTFPCSPIFNRSNAAVARASKGLHPPPFWMSYLKHRFIGPATERFQRRFPDPQKNFRKMKIREPEAVLGPGANAPESGRRMQSIGSNLISTSWTSLPSHPSRPYLSTGSVPQRRFRNTISSVAFSRSPFPIRHDAR